MTTRRPAAARLALLLALLAGCRHERPVSFGVVEPPPPLTGAPPLRLTYNLDSEWNPAFTFDGTGILYSFAVPERDDGDRCLGTIPAGGGTIHDDLCWRSGAERDSTDTVVSAAESPGGRLAFVAERSRRGAFVVNARALLAAPPHSPENAAVVMPLPTQGGASPFLWDGVRDLTWLDDSTLVFVAQYYSYQAGGSGTPPDTLMTGIEVVKLDLRFTPAQRRPYGLTRFASSVAAGAQPNTVIFTAGGDSRVFTLDITTGAVGLLYDFGALGIARDARLVNGKLVAVVGGFVSYGYESVHSLYVQRDAGGPVYCADLLGAAVPILLTPPGRVYRHLTLSPSGTTVVAEGYAADGASAAPSEVSDLYSIPVP